MIQLITDKNSYLNKSLYFVGRLASVSLLFQYYLTCLKKLHFLMVLMLHFLNKSMTEFTKKDERLQ